MKSQEKKAILTALQSQMKELDKTISNLKAMPVDGPSYFDQILLAFPCFASDILDSGDEFIEYSNEGDGPWFVIGVCYDGIEYKVSISDNLVYSQDHTFGLQSEVIDFLNDLKIPISSKVKFTAKFEVESYSPLSWGKEYISAVINGVDLVFPDQACADDFKIIDLEITDEFMKLADCPIP